MKNILFYICCATFFCGFTQNEASNWYFGFNSGITFNSANNTVTPLTNGSLSTIEGCASISDDTGNLLFYTDGITVWNKNHAVMTNGLGLLGDPSSTQSAIIVPKPDSDTIFYIFTVDDYTFEQPHFGLNYSTVDMSLDNGLGAITNKNVQLLKQCSEKITAVIKDCISGSIWVIAFADASGDLDFFNTFHAFEVNNLGVEIKAVTSTFLQSIFDPRGYLKLSPDGTKMVCANMTDGLFVYDFDSKNGTVSNQQEIVIQGASNYPYGVEFSPSGALLYVHSSNDYFDFENRENNNNPASHKSVLTQFNLLALDISASAIILDNRNLYRGALQLGPNGKIYRALSKTYNTGTSFLGAINTPDQIGIGCNYQHNAINLGSKLSSQGLPPFIASFFGEKIDIIKNGESSKNLALCDGTIYTLSANTYPGASYVWSKDKTILYETSNQLEVSESGQYELYINPNNGDCAIEGEAYVQFYPNPEAFDYLLLQCDEDGLLDGKTFFNLNEASAALSGNSKDVFIKFYTDISRTNEVNGDVFQNTSNPQTIYSEVINSKTGCFSHSELTLQVSLTDSNDITISHCDDDGLDDGHYQFNLNDYKNKITEGLPTGLDIAFYENYDDALLEQNKLDSLYTNTIASSHSIFARAENTNGCYGISSILLTVFPLPNMKSDETPYYCLNKFPEMITLDAGIINDSHSNYTYNWSNGATSYSINVNTIGSYTVTATNANGCQKSKTITIEPSNVATLNDINITDASSNNTITVLASGEGIYQYQLVDDKNNVIAPFQEDNIFYHVFPGIYRVYIKDIKNDCGEISKSLSVIGFPKYFSPNNDGVNDTWQIYGITEAFQPNTKIQIFNRFGKLIKEISPLGEGWNGQLNGQYLPNDDYWFMVKLQDGRVYKNHFTLKR
ncbi:T9SS type B sorting domain-containing protein [Tamlana fucoidanivorans]|uniref:T9SS type B sorting domain-containing protein n=1 Tax=Allotamlana fucoidanivorans TaxID=2583814 RepID=A0A5C4SHN9_9FLAO|nr:T9SS type B sorting domain-containing protein [Tamlana fucoidanivorans]TNJ43189.1 T9SS type B sorting domain-containing protein [Tamlana fucoidanivorans]